MFCRAHMPQAIQLASNNPTHLFDDVVPSGPMKRRPKIMRTTKHNATLDGLRGVESGLFHWVPRISGLMLAFLLVLSFVPPAIPAGWFYDVFCVMLVYPAIIICGAADALPSRCVPAALWAGRLSYPVYALHLPVVVQHFGRFNHWAGIPLLLAMFAAMIVAVIVALGALKLYDEPIQKRLSRFKKTGKIQQF